PGPPGATTLPPPRSCDQRNSATPTRAVTATAPTARATLTLVDKAGAPDEDVASSCLSEWTTGAGSRAPCSNRLSRSSTASASSLDAPRVIAAPAADEPRRRRRDETRRRRSEAALRTRAGAQLARSARA